MSEAEGPSFARLRDECRKLEDQLTVQAANLRLLEERFARYEIALRGAQIVVCTQDCDLRFTAINQAMFGRSVENILGRTDDEIGPAAVSGAITALKRSALASGEAKRGEFPLEDGSGARWVDLHIEPLRDHGGAIIGLACAVVDVTERKEGEAHLRLLLRELTHRSKNLLAVIQAMARQTGRHVESIDGFLDRFSARLPALAVSHDLLVRESWYGASIGDLIRGHLAAFVERMEERVVIEGPSVVLRPEAAQMLGLAMHELAVNAARFGALSVPGGRVLARWQFKERRNEHVLDFEWHESAGPKVSPRNTEGFGSAVIERNLTRALEAEVKLDFDPDGVRCRILIPASQILAAR